MYILNIASAIKKIQVNEDYYKRIGFSKENSYYLMKHQEKIIYKCLQLN